MFGLISRPTRRPCTPARSVLRVESLETRANPAAPVLSALTATWTDASHVVVSGQVIDQSPTAVWVNGGGRAAAFVSNSGTFSISLTTDGVNPIHVQAEDTQGQFSDNMMCTYGVANPVDTNSGAPILGGVTVGKSGNTWTIHGTLNGGTGLDTLIGIIGSTPGLNGETVTINGDGTFDIGFTLDPGASGGLISIVALDPITGNQLGTLWSGTVD